MCGGREVMSATTDIQRGGAKKKASLTPRARTTKQKAEQSGATGRGSAAVKAIRRTSLTVTKQSAASKNASTRVARTTATKSREEWLQDETTNAAKTATQIEEKVRAVETGEDVSDIKVGMSGNGCAKAGKPLTEAGKKRLVNRLLGLAETQATQGSFKITPADLIRLMQLHKEMNPQKDRKVTVQWIEDKPE